LQDSFCQAIFKGGDFNEKIDGVNLPSSLQSLTFGQNFNQSLTRVDLPSTPEFDIWQRF
jgi:hypothetical protein